MTTLQIFADYYQIYLCDPTHVEDWSALINDQTLDDRVITLSHTVVFGTGRNMIVPVDVNVHAVQPDLDAVTATASHSVLCGINCASGSLKLAGCTDYLPDAFTLPIRIGRIGVAFLSYDLDKIDPVDGLDGDDRYALHVWSAAVVPETRVLKRWNSGTSR